MTNINPSKAIGLALATIHFMAFFAFVIYIHLSQEGQDRLLWVIWLPIDFPVSYLVPAGFELISADDAHSSSFRSALPYLVHGLLGTIWWYFIPRIISYIYNKLFKYKQATF